MRARGHLAFGIGVCLTIATCVLVLGGGDGLALREILRYPHIEHVTV